MDTVYYRKIAEIVLRDVAAGDAVYDAAARAIDARNIKKSDRRKLREWMLAWCEQTMSMGYVPPHRR